MIKLAGIGHVLLRVADEEASKRFYRDALGFRIAEQDPEHGGVFMTLGDGFHTIDITQHPAPREASRPERSVCRKRRGTCRPSSSKIARGSGDHHRIGSPSSYHGKMPCR